MTCIYDHVEIAERNIGGSWSSILLANIAQPNLWTRGSLCRTRPLTVTLLRDQPFREREREILKGNNGWQIFTSRKLRASLCRHVFDNKINTAWHANKDASSRLPNTYAQIFHIYRRNSRHKFIWNRRQPDSIVNILELIFSPMSRSITNGKHENHPS